MSTCARCSQENPDVAQFGARTYEAEARLLLARQLGTAGRHAEAAAEAAAAAAFFRAAGAQQRSREVAILLQTG